MKFHSESVANQILNRAFTAVRLFKGGPCKSGEVIKTDPETLVEIGEICEEGEVQGEKLPRPTWVVGAHEAEIHWGTAAHLPEYTLDDVFRSI